MTVINRRVIDCLWIWKVLHLMVQFCIPVSVYNVFTRCSLSFLFINKKLNDLLCDHVLRWPITIPAWNVTNDYSNVVNVLSVYECSAIEVILNVFGCLNNWQWFVVGIWVYRLESLALGLDSNLFWVLGNYNFIFHIVLLAPEHAQIFMGQSV